MSWEYETSDMRRMLRKVLALLASRKLLYLLPPDIVEWWEGEKVRMEKERVNANR